MYSPFFCVWGTVTNLSRKYSVSRQFIYNEKHKLEYLISNNLNDNNLDKAKLKRTHVLKQIFSLRLNAKSSIIGISEYLHHFENQFNSVGFISQVLKKAGQIVGDKLDIDLPETLTIPVCCDEIFARQTPILVTIEPKSMAIIGLKLANGRKALDWIEFWQHIKNQNIEFSTLINDDGVGMKSAKEKFLQQTPRQRDTFHTVSHRLGLWKTRFEAAAYNAIEHEYNCLECLKKTTSKKIQQKRQNNYTQALVKTQQAVDLYEQFTFLYHCLLECFECFDKNGKLKDLQKVTDDFITALELLNTLKIDGINQEIKHINKDLEELFYYYHTAQSIVNELSTKIDPDILNQLCLAWQVHKKILKTKQINRSNALKRKEQYLLQTAKEFLEDKFEPTINQVYKELNNINQSSALVECINSLLRPYLNTSKNQPTQEMLNLFMFYHNHRRFAAGERKDKSPMELLTEKAQTKDWLELLMEKVQSFC